MMKSIRLASALVILACGAAVTHAQSDTSASSMQAIDRCYLVAIDEVPVPATEEGMLMSIEVEEGAVVDAEDLIAQIDDRQAVKAMNVALAEYKAARKKSENEISVEAAIKSQEVSKAEWDKAMEANRKTPGSYSDTEIRRLKLNYERAGLQAELARYENTVAAFEALAKYSQYEQTLDMIQRRKLTAPHAGFVNQVFKNEGDWVKPGDPILHLVRMDQLRVHGRANAALFDYRTLMGRKVAIEVTLTGGRTETVNATIGFASPVVDDDETFRVWADIDNPRDRSGWLFGPGMKARMILQ